MTETGQTPDPPRELAELASALCDGDLTPDQARRLEEIVGASPEARRFLLDFLFLHGELCWELHGTAAGEPAAGEPAEQAAPSERAFSPPAKRSRRHLLRSWAWTAALACLVLLGVTLLVQPTGPPPAQRATVAKVERLWNVQWADGSRQWQTENLLTAGDALAIQAGLVELTFPSGVQAILEGPARMVLVSAERAELKRGRLTARVTGGPGFAVQTDAGTFVDLGTEFGVWAQEEGRATLAVFEGAVQVIPVNGAASQTVQAGQAVLVTAASGATATVGNVRVPADTFVRELPDWEQVPSTARLRNMVASRADLLHHYPFEGESAVARRRDWRSHWDLMEAVMADGRGNGRVAYFVRGVDLSTGAVRPFRDAAKGNSEGVSLQTEMQFHPPRAMTVELLACVAEGADRQDGRIACAVATRGDADHCGFYLVAAEDLTLTMLLDADAPWAEASMKFVPGQWYYLACTWEEAGGQESDRSPITSVRCYAANISAGERELREVYRGDIPGQPPASRLGIGKGFDALGANAYPWSGSLDEVAIYESALDAPALQSHLDALWGAKR